MFLNSINTENMNYCRIIVAIVFVKILSLGFGETYATVILRDPKVDTLYFQNDTIVIAKYINEEGACIISWGIKEEFINIP